jgi:hypothetical protein
VRPNQEGTSYPYKQPGPHYHRRELDVKAREFTPPRTFNALAPMQEQPVAILFESL